MSIASTISAPEEMDLACLPDQDLAVPLFALDDGHRDALLHALADALSYRALAAAAACPACLVHPAMLCPDHAEDLDYMWACHDLAAHFGITEMTL